MDTIKAILSNEIVLTGFVGTASALTTWFSKALWEERKRQKDTLDQHHKDGTLKLKHHPLFKGSLQRHITTLQTSFNLGNAGKTLVFKDILMTNFSMWEHRLLELAESVDKCNDTCPVADQGDCNKLVNLNMEAFNTTMIEYTDYYRKSGNYSADEIACLDIVMAKFNKWNNIRMESMIERINYIANDKYLSANCRIAQALIFEAYIGTFADTMADATRTLGEINGDLNGLVFRGVEIKSCHNVEEEIA